MTEPYPSFFLVGGKKCGTSAVFRQLEAHPDIGFARKELHYFSYGFDPGRREDPRVISDEAEYRALYAPLAGTPVLADASPSYLVIPEAAARLREAVPHARIAMILRHPVDRLLSDYHHEQAAGREPRDLATALAQEAESGKQRYRWRSSYARHLERFLALFPPDQVRVYVYDDLRADERGLMRSMYSFVGVEEDFVAPPSQHSQRSGVVRSQTFNRVIRSSGGARRLARSVLPKRLYRGLGYRLYNANVKAPEPVDPAWRARLCEEFEPDVQAVEDVLHRELDTWRV